MSIVMIKYNFIKISVVFLSIFLSSTAWNSSTFAQKKNDKIKFDRSSAKIKIKKTPRVNSFAKKQTKSLQGTLEPTVSSEQFLQIETLSQDINDAVIRELIFLIQDTPMSEANERAALLFRLAESWAKKRRYFHFKGMELHAAIDVSQGSKKQRLIDKQQDYFTKAKKNLIQAVKIYRKIARDSRYKKYKRMDEMLFYYSYTLRQVKYDDEARKVLVRLVRDHAKSSYAPQAFLYFGETYFEENKLDLAEKFYKRVLKFKKSHLRHYALYKLGWVYLNQKRFKNARTIFAKVVSETRGSQKEETIFKGARRDYVRAFSQSGSSRKALRNFKKIDKSYAIKMLELLGDFYVEQGKSVQTIYIYRQLMSLMPQDSRLCDWERTIVNAVRSQNKRKKYLAEIFQLVNVYQNVRDKNIVSGDSLQECKDDARITLGNTAKFWHREAHLTRNSNRITDIDKLYHRYLDVFSEAKDAPEMHYYWGDLLWIRAKAGRKSKGAAKRWEAAATQFLKVAQAKQVSRTLIKDAAFAAVQGWKNALGGNIRTKIPANKKTKIGVIPKPRKIPYRQTKMIEAFDFYIDNIVDGNKRELIAIKFIKGRTYWIYRHYDKAIPVFEDIVENHIQHKAGKYAVNLLLDSLNSAQRYDDLIAWVDKLFGMRKFLARHPTIAKNIEQLKVTSLRKSAELFQKNKKYGLCGDRYLVIYNRDPDAKKMDEILYNAGYCYELGGLLGASIRVREILIKKYPDVTLAKKALYLLGHDYGSIAYYDKAATKLELFAEKYPLDKRTATALNDAVFYRKGLGQYDKAIEDTNAFIARTKDQSGGIQKAAAAFFSLITVYEQRKNDNDVIRHLRDYLKRFGKFGGLDRRIIARYKLGEILWRKSCKIKGVDGACIKVVRSRAIAKRSKKKKRKILPRQCGAASKNKLEMVNRDASIAKQARKEFRKGIALWNKGKAASKIPGASKQEKELRKAAAQYAVAASEFYITESEYEKFLSIPFPGKLDFNPRKPKKTKRSLKRFKTWKKNKDKQAGKTQKMYASLRKFQGGGEHWIIAGAARSGQLWQNYADVLFTAEIPKFLRRGRFAQDKIDAYCDKMVEVAEPLENQSINAFSFCLNESTKRKWFNSWSVLCENELGRIRPLDYPSTAELHGEPTLTGIVLDKQSILFPFDKKERQ